MIYNVLYRFTSNKPLLRMIVKKCNMSDTTSKRCITWLDTCFNVIVICYTVIRKLISIYKSFPRMICVQIKVKRESFWKLDNNVN